MPAFVSHMCKDHDLWRVLHHAVRTAIDADYLQRFVKVRSHEDRAAYSDAIEKWAIRGNDAADQVALQERQCLPTGLQQAWTRYDSQFHEARNVVTEVHSHFVRVGQATVLATKDIARQDDQAWNKAVTAPRQIDAHDVTLSVLPSLDSAPGEHTMRFVLEPLHDWLRVLLRDRTHTPLWVSGAQLLVHSQMHTSDLGFRFNQRTNQWNMLQDSIHVDPFSFSNAANWIFALLRCFCRTMGIEYH